MPNKKKYLFFLCIFSTIAQADSSLENDLMNFVDSKFQSEKYEDLDFYNVEMTESFNPDSINVTEDVFDPTVIDKINVDSKMNFEKKDFTQIKNIELVELENTYRLLKEEQNSLSKVSVATKTNEEQSTIGLISNDILAFANTIPLLKTKHAKLIQTTIQEEKHFLIKFEKPQNVDVSLKKIAALSFSESNIKKLEEINALVEKIKLFNKMNDKSFFVNKEIIYIPVSFLK